MAAQELITLAALALVAQAPVPATPAEVRARTLPGLLANAGDQGDAFDERFRAQVPAAQMAAVTARLRQQLGAPRGIEKVTALGPVTAEVVVGFERGSATIALAVEAVAPHRITGLRITGTRLRDDSLAAVAQAIRALPGRAGLAVYALEPGQAPRALVAVDADAVAPVGSAFKLWILAELVREVRAGTRRWRDVVALGPPALPTGQMQRWPTGAPVTLQTLATMAMSISDNTAADTLMTTLGRARVEAAAAASGIATPARTLPLLTTREAAAIKADDALAAAWARGDVAQRRALLASRAARIAGATLDPTLFDGSPRAAETVEWFASPGDMARTLDWLRRHGDPTAQAILAINPGLPPALARRFGYAGYKGGSEPGVVAMNHLLATRDGRWFAITGNWHRPDAAVDEDAFAALVARAATLLADPIPPTPRPAP